jgi:hypothetical protein
VIVCLSVLTLFLLFSVVQIILIKIYEKIYSNKKDQYIVALTTLEKVVDNYLDVVLEKKVNLIKKDYNLDPTSKVNSIIAFEKRVNELISESSLDIMKSLSPKVLKTLTQYFSNNSLALLIINRIRNLLV